MSQDQYPDPLPLTQRTRPCLLRVECSRDIVAPHQWPRFRDVNVSGSPGHLTLALVATAISPGHDNRPLPTQMMRTPLWSTHCTPGVLNPHKFSGKAAIKPNLQTRKRWLREVMTPARGHTACKGQSWE